jgi:hypothetical protein
VSVAVRAALFVVSAGALARAAGALAQQAEPIQHS